MKGITYFSIAPDVGVQGTNAHIPSCRIDQREERYRVVGMSSTSEVGVVGYQPGVTPLPADTRRSGDMAESECPPELTLQHSLSAVHSPPICKYFTALLLVRLRLPSIVVVGYELKLSSSSVVLGPTL